MTREDDDEAPHSPPPPPPPRRKLSGAGPPILSVEISRPQPTTAVSSIDIQTVSFPDGSRGTFSSESVRATPSPGASQGAHASSQTAGDRSDAMSVVSLGTTMRPPCDLASLIGAGEWNRKSAAWKMLRSQSAAAQPFEMPARLSAITGQMPDVLETFATEFDDIATAAGTDAAGGDDAYRLRMWESKLKHYMILSSAGKPIYSRHGDPGLVNSYMGIIQTIMSFYEGAGNPLLGFTAGNARFVMLTEGPLYLVAISRLGESDAQIRDQLEALYMQVLSTLTLPRLRTLFANRPSTDLRKPLEGTEPLLSSLADSFTRGSPSALLNALECLRLCKSPRVSINNAFLRASASGCASGRDKLLCGIIAVGGQLVSVIRPRRHSLHPSDLQLVFNMLFESGGIQAGGGESWVPLCLPAFNNSGYLYMYVSFFDTSCRSSRASGPLDDQKIALVLISSDRESFYDMHKMRENMAEQLTRSGDLAVIRDAVRRGRPRVAHVAPNAQISHFIFKSRDNLQFCMSALEPGLFGSRSSSSSRSRSSSTNSSRPELDEEAAEANALGPTPSPTSQGSLDPTVRRRLMTVYHELHAAVHAQHAHLKVLHRVAGGAAGLAWVTPAFELYCVAGPNTTRQALSQAANKIVKWVGREEERLFIIGGGLF